MSTPTPPNDNLPPGQPSNSLGKQILLMLLIFLPGFLAGMETRSALAEANLGVRLLGIVAASLAASLVGMAVFWVIQALVRFGRWH